MSIEIFYEKLVHWLEFYVPKIIVAIILFLIGQAFIRLLNAWIKSAFQRRKMDNSLRPFLRSLISALLQILLVLAIMQIIGVQMTIFAAFVGALGVAAGLALSGTLQNFTGGVLILIIKPYRVGDIIVSQGQEGTVCAINIFYTEIITYDNKTVVIPNSKLSNEVIINLSREGNRRVDIELKFNYGYDFHQLKSILLKAIDGQPYILNNPSPQINISQIDPDGYKLILNAWVDANHFTEYKMKLQQLIVDTLKGQDYKLPGMS